MLDIVSSEFCPNCEIGKNKHFGAFKISCIAYIQNSYFDTKMISISIFVYNIYYDLTY